MRTEKEEINSICPIRGIQPRPRLFGRRRPLRGSIPPGEREYHLGHIAEALAVALEPLEAIVFFSKRQGDSGKILEVGAK